MVRRSPGTTFDSGREVHRGGDCIVKGIWVRRIGVDSRSWPSAARSEPLVMNRRRCAHDHRRGWIALKGVGDKIHGGT